MRVHALAVYLLPLLRADDMIQTSLLLCSVPVVLSIIVTDPPPPAAEGDYKYAYAIEDPSTGDSKSQHEVRLGDVVSGAYSVVGPDGTKRTVEYTADSKHGFKATVREEPAMDHIQQQLTQHIDNSYLYSTGIEYQKPSYQNVHKPIVYAFEKAPVSSKIQDLILFTPTNEITSDRIAFDHGKFFEPAKK